MLLDVAFFISGAVISWILTHLYYRRGNRDQNKFFNKFSKDIREMILADKRDSLSVLDLNDLLRKKIIDYEIPGPFKYKACPKCGSSNLWRGKDYWVDVEAGDNGEAVYSGTPYSVIECMDCHWRKAELESNKEAFEG
jgi:hypothetical protein